MSLKHAILGFLNYYPMSGYDLKTGFDRSVQHFWTADQSQIYRTLARLEDAGLVEVEVIEQADRPDRKLHRITEAGRDEFMRWMRTPLPPGKSRSAALIQVFFAGQLEDGQVLTMFEETRDVLKERLASHLALPEVVKPYRDLVDSDREAFFWMLTLECGIKVAEAQLEWVESVIRRLEAGEYPRV